MGSICAGIKRDGSRCRATVGPGQTHCYGHDPRRADERSLAASRAGRARPNGEITEIKTDLQAMVDALLSGELDRGTAAVCGQLKNVKLRAVEIQRRTSDMTDLLTRLEAVEQAASRLRGASS